jgi:hypothetical protein
MSWPDGIFNGLRLDGRCRDLLTGRDGRAEVLGLEELTATTNLDRTIAAISSKPAVAGIETLVGARGGGKLRSALEEAVPSLRSEGAPLYLLLDDLAGASLIAGFAWSRWMEHLPELSELTGRMPLPQMEGICSGFRPGSSALSADGTPAMIPQRLAVVPALCDAADPIGFHKLDEPDTMAMRRARRIDVWREGTQLKVDAMFRDSCWEPDGAEVAVHEYSLSATADATSGLLTDIEALPRVLPFAECPAAAANVERLEGLELSRLRTEVLEVLQGTDCCTHLNDALRSLAEVPILGARLEREVR